VPHSKGELAWPGQLAEYPARYSNVDGSRLLFMVPYWIAFLFPLMNFFVGRFLSVMTA